MKTKNGWINLNKTEYNLELQHKLNNYTDPDLKDFKDQDDWREGLKALGGEDASDAPF